MRLDLLLILHEGGGAGLDGGNDLGGSVVESLGGEGCLGLGWPHALHLVVQLADDLTEREQLAIRADGVEAQLLIGLACNPGGVSGRFELAPQLGLGGVEVLGCRADVGCFHLARAVFGGKGAQTVGQVVAGDLEVLLRGGYGGCWLEEGSKSGGERHHGLASGLTMVGEVDKQGGQLTNGGSSVSKATSCHGECFAHALDALAGCIARDVQSAHGL